MRIVAWNIRAGGGARVDAIAAQLRRWRPDIVALSEFRGTPPSQTLAARLSARGLVRQQTTVDPHRPARNSLLVASRYPLRSLSLAGPRPESTRWLPLAVEAPQPFALAAMHAPNMVTGRKYPFLDAVHGVARRWRNGPALIIGDTNSGRMGVDEESSAFTPKEEAWIDTMEAEGWSDAFRLLHPRKRDYTWYSPNAGNGFRLDQAFPNTELVPRLKRVRHLWGKSRGDPRREALSDHAALIVDLAG